MSEMPMSKRESQQGLVIPTLPALVFVLALLLTSILLSLVMSLVVSFRLGDVMARPNPFNTYELVWPGQTLADVAEYAQRTPEGHITCYSNTPVVNEYPGLVLLVMPQTDMFYMPAQPMTCMDKLEKGTFRSITITIKDNRIRALNLFSDYLQQDVLSLYWGVPDAMTKGYNGESLYLHWDRSTYQATATLTKPYLVVSLVTLVAK
jgi:hypothetical protein